MLRCGGIVIGERRCDCCMVSEAQQLVSLSREEGLDDGTCQSALNTYGV